MSIAITEREKWLEQRLSGIGASEAAAAIGCSPWQSRYALYQLKTGAVQSDHEDESEAMRWGNLLEPAIRSEVSNMLDVGVVHRGQYALVRSERNPFMLATLDGYFPTTSDNIDALFRARGMESPQGSGVLQIKTTSAWNDADFDGDWPLHYQVQCQHELSVVDYSWGVLAVLIGGQKLRMFPYSLNAKFISALVEAERQFWALVESRESPPVDGSDATADIIKRMYPEDHGEEIELPDEAVIWDTQRNQALADKRDAETRLSEADNQIKAALGTAAVGKLPGGGSYTWKTQHRAGFTVEPTSFRVLRRNKK